MHNNQSLVARFLQKQAHVDTFPAERLSLVVNHHNKRQVYWEIRTDSDRTVIEAARLLQLTTQITGAFFPSILVIETNKCYIVWKKIYLTTLTLFTLPSPNKPLSVSNCINVLQVIFIRCTRTLTSLRGESWYREMRAEWPLCASSCTHTCTINLAGCMCGIPHTHTEV